MGETGVTFCLGGEEERRPVSPACSVRLQASAQICGLSEVVGGESGLQVEKEHQSRFPEILAFCEMLRASFVRPPGPLLAHLRNGADVTRPRDVSEGSEGALMEALSEL
jgi:hypothetical protein